MDFPVTVELGPLSVRAHVLLEALAYAVGFALYRRARRSRGDVVGDSERWHVVAAAAVGAAVGSRALLWAAALPDLVAGRLGFADWFAQKTIVGALLGGLVAVEWAKRRLGVSRATGDLFALPLAVSIAIGRVGCVLSGTADATHGLPSSLPWAFDLGDGVPRHPAPLYEILFLGALSLALAVGARRPHREGDLFKRFLAAYLLFRLVADFGKPREPLLGLSSIQWAAAAGLLYYLPHAPRLLGLQPSGDADG